MARSIKKGPYVFERLLKKVKNLNEAGKKEVIGRPNLYATTNYFLDFMGINDLSELIDVSNIEVVDEEMTLFEEPKLAQEETRHQNKINEITNYYDTKIKQDSDKLAKAQDIYNKSSSSQPNNHDILQYKEELRSDTETKPKALAGEDQTYQTNIAKIKNQ